jgi:hypothetical protein
MTVADKTLMNHETTTLLGILCKLEFVAHQEIEDAEDQVGRTINGLILDLRRKLGRPRMHTPRAKTA